MLTHRDDRLRNTFTIRYLLFAGDWRPVIFFSLVNQIFIDYFKNILYNKIIKCT